MSKRKLYTTEFKAKVALEAIRGEHTIAEMASRHALHPNLIGLWKKQAVDKLARVFDDKAGEREAGREAEISKLHAKIGELVVERDLYELHAVKPFVASAVARLPDVPLARSGEVSFRRRWASAARINL